MTINAKRIAVVLLMLPFMIINLSGCSIAGNTDGKAEDYIANIYEKLKIEAPEMELINIKDFEGEKGKFALVELKFSPNSNTRFELVNLENGNREIMPLASESELLEIINENQIIFLSNGKYPDGSKDFPYISRCIRVKNDDPQGNENFNFICIREDKYLNINEPSEFGRQTDGTAFIESVIATVNGIQVLYKYDFIAGGPINPKTEISYDKENNRLLLNVENCKIKNTDDIRNIKPASIYLHSVQISEHGNDCEIAIALNNTELQYNVKHGVLKADSPFFELRFTEGF